MKKFIIIIFLFIFSIPLNSQWVQVANGILNYELINCFTKNGNYLFSGTAPGVYVSTNNGLNWTATTLFNGTILAITSSNNYIYATGSSGFVNISSNNGASWTNYGPSLRIPLSIAVSGNTLITGTHTFGVYISTNNGINWTQTSLNNKTVYSVAIIGNNLFAGLDSYEGVYKSTNYGATWFQTALNNRTVLTLAVKSDTIYAGSDALLYSTNLGNNWIQTTFSNNGIYSIIFSGDNIFVGAGFGFYLSTNNGVSWLQRNEGFGNNNAISSLITLNNYIFAGKPGESIWRRPISEVVGINSICTEVPDNYSLHQNYPNPFNPATKIRFDIPNSGNVNISVFDVLGRKVAVIVDQQLTPGTYETDFDAGNLSSGIYYYRIAVHPDKITSEYYTETSKMVLVR